MSGFMEIFDMITKKYLNYKSDGLDQFEIIGKYRIIGQIWLFKNDKH